MHHLQHPVVKGGSAGHDTAFADRQELFQKIPARVEVGQREVAGLIAGVDLIRHAGTVRRRWPVAIHGHCDGHDGIGNDVAQLRPCSPVDRARRQVKEQVEDACRLIATEQPAVELFQPRPDTGKRGDRRKQRIEQARPHSPPTLSAPMLARTGALGNAAGR